MKIEKALPWIFAIAIFFALVLLVLAAKQANQAADVADVLDNGGDGGRGGRGPLPDISRDVEPTMPRVRVEPFTPESSGGGGQINVHPPVVH